MDKEIISIRNVYYKAVENAGGIPIGLCYTKDIDEVLNILDGIILSGGGDIDGKYINQVTHIKANCIFPERDEYELNLCKKAFKYNIPVLGICRGEQILNIAYGGNINQHIENHIQEAKRDKPFHKVYIEKDSMLYSILKEDIIYVNSFHHQVVSKKGKNIKICAYSCDGYAEAVEVKEKNFVLGVQWHPEAMVNDEIQQKIFKALIKHAIEFNKIK